MQHRRSHRAAYAADHRARFPRALVIAPFAVLAVLAVVLGSTLLRSGAPDTPEAALNLSSRPAGGADVDVADPTTSPTAAPTTPATSPTSPTSPTTSAPAKRAAARHHRPTRSSAGPRPRSSTRPATAAPRPKPSRPARPKPSGPARTTPPPAGGGNSSVAAQVLSLTNAERAKAGCKALTTQSTLTKVAQAHSADMAANNYFSHDSQNGKSPFDRMTAAGYRFGAAAENIAMGQQTAASVMDAWMNSPGHKANILNCTYTQIGIGYARSGGGSPYWTQDFGTPL